MKKRDRTEEIEEEIGLIERVNPSMFRGHLGHAPHRHSWCTLCELEREYEDLGGGERD